MKKLLLLLCSIFIFIGCKYSVKVDNDTQTNTTDKVVSKTDSMMDYDTDEYGMKQYILAFLKRGPNRDQDSATSSRIQREHLDNIGRMAENGTLVLAGPFLDDGDIRGIYIFNVKTIEEAEKLTATDPAIKAGRLVMELHPWYGSAALLEVNNLHNKISKKDF